MGPRHTRRFAGGQALVALWAVATVAVAMLSFDSTASSGTPRTRNPGPSAATCRETLGPAGPVEVCLHHDAAAPGVDLQTNRSIAELEATTYGPGRGPAAREAAAATAGIACVGDGLSGNRVQAVYAVPAGRKDRSARIIPLIRKWAADVDATVRLSAAETGGTRRVRWVHNSNCVLSVAKARVSRAAITSPWRLDDDLAARGHGRWDRRYLVWLDASYECGVGGSAIDDTRGVWNQNNGYPAGHALYARIDTGCWGRYRRDGSTEAHELMHTLGAVQESAPHSTALGHCWDEHDVMCYPDGSGVRMRRVCARTHAKRLDCRHDDYFHTQPAEGTYLALHWNAADSSFLTGTDQQPPTVRMPAAAVTRDEPGRPEVLYAIQWIPDDDRLVSDTRLEESKDGGTFAPVELEDGQRATEARLSLLRGSGHQFRVQVMDTAGRWSAWSTGEPFTVPTDSHG